MIVISYAKHHVTAEDKAAVIMVLNSDRLTQGPTVELLEAKLCEVSGAKYAVAVNSGTAALHLAYLACGVGPEQSIVTSPLSFVATANAALYCGADVEFVDTTEKGLIEVTAEWLMDRTVDQSMRGEPLLVPVTLGGNDPSWEWIGAPPRVVTDASHGPIAHLDGAATTFSFHPAKHVAAGEGGAIVTDDGAVWSRCFAMRDHGRVLGNVNMDGSVSTGDDRVTVELGFNYRMDEMSAALALSQLGRYEWNVTERQRIAAIYDAAFKDKVRTVPHSDQSARHLYQLLVEDRDTVRQQLAERGVGTQIHYHPIIPLQPYYHERWRPYDRGDVTLSDIAKERWPNAVWHSEHTLSIPMFPTLTEQEVETVIAAVLEVCG